MSVVKHYGEVCVGVQIRHAFPVDGNFARNEKPRKSARVPPRGLQEESCFPDASKSLHNEVPNGTLKQPLQLLEFGRPSYESISHLAAPPDVEGGRRTPGR